MNKTKQSILIAAKTKLANALIPQPLQKLGWRWKLEGKPLTDKCTAAANYIKRHGEPIITVQPNA